MSGEHGSHAVSVKLYEEGIILEKDGTSLFVAFNENGGEIKYKVSKAAAKYSKKAPLESFQVATLIGILKIQFGYLICVTEFNTVVSVSNLQIHKVKKTVLVPLQFESAEKFFQEQQRDYNPVGRDSGDSLREDNAELEGQETPPEEDIDLTKTSELKPNPAGTNENILFTKIGILTQSFKTTPLLGLNAFQKADGGAEAENHELFDIRTSEDGVERIETPHPKRGLTFSNETTIALDYNAISEASNHVTQGGSHLAPKFIRKILKNVVLFLNKGGFYFSYDINIINKFGYSNGSFYPKLQNSHSMVSDFFWNKDLAAEILEVLKPDDPLLAVPLIQGFVEIMTIKNITTEIEEKEKQEDLSAKLSAESEVVCEEPPVLESDTRKPNSFSAGFNKLKTNFKSFSTTKPSSPETEVSDAGRFAKLILISKRSNRRCGVRYLRRGIDDDANVANFIETTQMCLIEDLNIFTSYQIIRGSIPVYFEQDPSKLHPQPKITRSLKQCEGTLMKHFENIIGHYKDVTSISLVEKQKREQEVGEAFQTLMIDNHLKFVWFDFHDVCKNMRYDKITQLLDQSIENELLNVADQIDVYGWSDNDSDEQRGVFRVNCIDCLDRTNIICKFICAQVLNKQLEHFKLTNGDKDLNTKLSHLWANNGDAISQQYCSTNAMKGDFTRTNKRNYKGLMNDAILSLTRYYYNSVTDFFNQFIIDYLLYHNDNDLNFLENFESLLENFDPNSNSAVNLKKQLIMNNVLELFAAEDSILGSWWMKSCFELNTLIKEQQQLMKNETELKECILILARANLFVVNVDIDTNKLSYYRISTDNVTSLQYGHYFTSTYTSNDRNPRKNVGLKTGFNTYTIFESEIISKAEDDSLSIELVNSNEETVSVDEFDFPEFFLSMKFDPAQVRYNDCKNAIKLISNVCYRSQLNKKDLMTLEEAKKSSSIFKNIDHQVKKFIWG